MKRSLAVGIAITVAVVFSSSLLAAQSTERKLLEFQISATPLTGEKGGVALCLINEDGSNTLLGAKEGGASGDFFVYEVVGAGQGLDVQNVLITAPPGWSCSAEARQGNLLVTMQPLQDLATDSSDRYCFQLTGVELKPSQASTFHVSQRLSP